jgi:hypothetical protein
MTTNTATTWHDLADQLTDHQREILTSLEDRLTRIGVTHAATLVLAHARMFAGLPQ